MIARKSHSRTETRKYLSHGIGGKTYFSSSIDLAFFIHHGPDNSYWTPHRGIFSSLQDLVLPRLKLMNICGSSQRRDLCLWILRLSFLPHFTWASSFCTRSSRNKSPYFTSFPLSWDLSYPSERPNWPFQWQSYPWIHKILSRLPEYVSL